MANQFVPRLTSDGIAGDPKWNYPGNPYPSMPNCTNYAYGRFWEIIGRNPVGLGGGQHAGEWINYPAGFQTGMVPALGAIACWYNPNPSSGEMGHVAVVEEILPNGDIITSNSYWNGTYFALEQNSKDGFGANQYLVGWMVNYRHYQLRGFIYADGYAPQTYYEWISRESDTGKKLRLTWEQGTINTQGNNANSNNYIRTILRSIDPSTKLKMVVPTAARMYIFEYDINGNFISRTLYSATHDHIISSNTYGIRFACCNYPTTAITPSSSYRFIIYNEDFDGGAVLTEEEMQNNASIIYTILKAEGWSDSAIAGAVGCMQYESYLNPAAIEEGRGLPTQGIDNFAGGLGLLQWYDLPLHSGTKPNPLMWYSNQENEDWDDGTFQTNMLLEAMNSNVTDCGLSEGKRWGWTIADLSYTAMTFSNYQSIADPNLAAYYWYYNMLTHTYPAEDGRLPLMQEAAQYWYNYFLGISPEPPDDPSEPTGQGVHKMPLWMKIKPHRRRL